MQRIFLFLLTNLAVLVVLGIVTRLLGINPQGMIGLLVMAAVFGMGGAFISLAMSKWSAKRATGAQVIEQPSNEVERWLYQTVEKQSLQAGIKMPEVAIYDSPAPNAFATGMRRDDSLVAVSTGLMRNMNRDEVEAVLAHEVSHVANGDMVTLALIQGVVNTFVIVLSRVIGQFIDRAVFKNEHGTGIGYWISTMILEIVLGILAMAIVMWFSRYREFHADAGAAKLAGSHKMIAALQRLQSGQQDVLPEQLQAFGIQGSGKQSLTEMLFSSHPPLEQRIAALQGR